MLKLKLMTIIQAKFKLICDRISATCLQSKLKRFGFCLSCYQCDQIGQFIGLWGNFKAFGNN